METINLNNQSTFILRLLAVVAVFAAIIFAGRADYNEEIMQQMSEQTYHAISQELGTTDASRIVNEFVENRQKWEAYEDEQ